MNESTPPEGALPRSLTSPLLRAAGFSHGFSVRRPDDWCDTQLESLARTVGVRPASVYQASQVHGARVVHAGGDPEALRKQEADALVAGAGANGSAPLAVGVRVADCVPVLVGDRASGAAAAIHAGWRGVVAGVIDAAIHEMPAGAKVAAIGPCIGPCCFEVGADVGAQIALACGDQRAIARRSADKAHVDLRIAVRALLRLSGLADADVDDVAGCTKCDPVRFFSYRRDGANAGRQLAIIVSR